MGVQFGRPVQPGHAFCKEYSKVFPLMFTNENI
jgi:hypothetical protein